MKMDIDFPLMVAEKAPARNVERRPGTKVSLVVASDTQVGPMKYPGAGALILDQSNGERVGSYCQFNGEALALSVLGVQTH